MASPYFVNVTIYPREEREIGLLERIGGWQVAGWSDGNQVAETLPQVLSPLHGRSAWISDPRLGNVSIKGVGWTLGPVCFFPSPKDSQLYFGLYPLRDGLREWGVSEFLAENDVGASRVLGVATFEPVGFNKIPKFQDGSEVEPALLYSSSRTSWRVADLPWMYVSERVQLLEEVAAICGWSLDFFVRDFCCSLGKTMARYHQLDCINDTLSSDNVTLAAEIVDYEWFTTPNHPLPDGSQYENASLRKRKEATYAYEIGCFLAHAIGRPADTIHILPALIDGYCEGSNHVLEELKSMSIEMERYTQVAGTTD